MGVVIDMDINGPNGRCDAIGTAADIRSINKGSDIFDSIGCRILIVDALSQDHMMKTSLTSNSRYRR